MKTTEPGEFDTETINRPGHGEACLLAKGMGEDVSFLEFPKDFDAIFAFLAEKKTAEYYCYNMDFDARAIIHDNFVPYEVVESIALYGRAFWRGYRIEYISTKMLQVSRKGEGGFRLYDLKCFYQTSLAKASKAHVPTEHQKKDFPKEWYNEMDICLKDSRRAVLLDYARHDILALRALKKKILASVKAIGLDSDKLLSPASVAARKWGDTFKRIRPPDYINAAFEPSFFGGRIEVARLGLIGPSKLWDIHSAYPAIFAGLTDPRGSMLMSGREWEDRGARYGCYHVIADIPPSWRFGPFAVAEANGDIIYPVGMVRTYIGRAGLELAKKYSIPIKVLFAWEIFPDHDDLLFPEVESIYSLRKDPEKGQACKLAMNSAYGLLCEKENKSIPSPGKIFGGKKAGAYFVRSYSIFGRYTNYPLAAEITEKTRLKLWEIAYQYPDKVHFFATDGILTDADIELPTGPGLGEWGLEGEYDKSIILGCGRYVLYQGLEIKKFRIRGFPCGPDIIPSLERCELPYIDIPSLETESLREWARAWAIPDLNVLTEIKRRLVPGDEKRHFRGILSAVGDYWKKGLDSSPYLIYHEDIGGRLCQKRKKARKSRKRR